MVARFRKASAGLLQAQQAQPEQRDKGTYTYLLARPSKRLALALSVDREILVLFSPYKEQQQRTIKTARELIAESDGRLESTIAIIVHKEHGGSVKLKKWGRMLGLSVLPVFVDECPTTPEELEHLLSLELFSHDPFDVTGPVSDDDNFFGRRNEAQDLARKLQSGQIRSCLGIRKIGKTSVINRIINEARRFHDCYCVMMDCSRDEIWKLDASDLMMALADAVDNAQTSQERYAVVTPANLKTEITLSSRKLRDAVSKAGKPILIFVDEIDYITPGSPTTSHWKTEFNPFWRNLRAVYQESLRDSSALSVFASGYRRRRKRCVGSRAGGILVPSSAWCDDSNDQENFPVRWPGV